MTVGAILLTCLAGAGGAAAQDPLVAQVAPAPPAAPDTDLDLHEALDAALLSHPAIRQAGSLVEQRQAEERIVRSDGRPVIEYSLQPGFNPESNRDAILQLNVTGRVPVYDFGRQRARRQSAELRTRQYEFMGAGTAETVALDLVNEYLKFALWRDAVAAADLQIEQLRAIRDRIEMRVRAGLADISDLRRTDVSISRAELQRNQVHNQMEMAADRIHALSSRTERPVITLEEASLLLRPGTAIPPETLEAVPSIGAARSEWEASERDVRAANAGRYPTISVGVSNSSYVMDERGPRNNGTTFDNRTQFGVFLTGRVAFGGGARHQVAAAQAASVAAQSRYQTEMLGFDMAMTDLARRRREAEARAEEADAIIGILEGARDLYWQEYILSKRRLTEVFEIEREIYQSRVEQFQARADELSALAEQLGLQGLLVTTLRNTYQADSQ